MTRFAWASDLHLDHLDRPGHRALDALLHAIGAPAVVVTGDIANAPTLATALMAMAAAARVPVHFVLGNHDHFGGSVGAVRDAITALGEQRPDIRWLPPAGVVRLDAKTVLVGVDGWADGRLGDPLATPLVLNDDRLIAELAAQPLRAGKVAVKRALADADAARLEVLIARALDTDAATIVIATHVPPFAEVLPRSGRLASPQWLPILVCAATGAVIRRAAQEYPSRRFEVFCGHTHVAADVRLADNLRCRVMAARYGEPRVETVQL